MLVGCRALKFQNVDKLRAILFSLIRSEQWCRRRQCRGNKINPKSGIVKNFGKIPENLGKICGNPGKIFKNPGKIPKYLGKITEIPDKTGAQRCQLMNTFFTPKKGLRDLCGRKFVGKKWNKNFSNTFGEFDQKSLTPPKICLLQHLRL